MICSSLDSLTQLKNELTVHGVELVFRIDLFTSFAKNVIVCFRFDKFVGVIMFVLEDINVRMP